MDLLTQPESAEELRLSERTLERHREAGTGPKFVKLGRRIFYRRADLQAWIADRTCRSTSEADKKLECIRSPASDDRVPSDNNPEPASQPPHPPLLENSGSHPAQGHRRYEKSGKKSQRGVAE